MVEGGSVVGWVSLVGGSWVGLGGCSVGQVKKTKKKKSAPVGNRTHEVCVGQAVFSSVCFWLSSIDVASKFQAVFFRWVKRLYIASNCFFNAIISFKGAKSPSMLNKDSVTIQTC